MTDDQRIAEAVSAYYADPLGFVLFAFPWDTEKSIQLVKLPEEYRKKYPNATYGPDKWACDFLEELGEQIRDRNFDGRTAVEPIRFSTASGHGIGKTALTSWLILFIMSTRPMANGKVTAGTSDQLKAATWSELGYWWKMCITRDWFHYSSGRGAMALYNKEHKEKWKVTGQTCKKEEAQSFAGQHAPNSTSFYIFDEASEVPDEVFVVRDNGMTDGEPMAFDFGNPVHNTGRFFEQCIGNLQSRYHVRQIDSRSVQITNKKLHEEWIQDFGLDSDYVKVRILGQFPSVGSIQFIPTTDVTTACEKPLSEDLNAPVILGVDVARFGDDASVIYIRHGRDARTWSYRLFRGLDTVQLAGQVAGVIREFGNLKRPVSATFVDGTGVGGGVVDNLRQMGYNVIEVQAASRPVDAKTYKYKSDECWGRMREALRAGKVVLPNDEKLRTELTQRQYGYTPNGLLHLETKRDMKSRGIASPNIADALALTFAQDLVMSEPMQSVPTVCEYDPFEWR